MLTIDQIGRQRTAVNQPAGGGGLYPFVTPSTGIQELLSDFYLSYRDDICAFTPPFSVVWLHGFGDDVVTPPPGYPTPMHARDLIVIDAASLVVFDSTQATAYHERPWGNRTVIEWDTADSVCRVVWMRAWRDWEIPRAYDNYIVPVDGRLDARTYERLPLRVLAFVVNDALVTGNVLFDAGYNIALASVEPTRQDGGQFIDQINIDTVVGAGLGRFPACEDTQILIRRINGAGPDASGNFTITLGDCYRNQLPLFVTDNGHGARTAEYSHAGSTAQQAHAMIRVFNDCTPCCKCDYFYDTYAGMTRVWDRWAGIAAQLESIRDELQNEMDRWKAQYDCRRAQPAQLVVQNQGNCKAFVGGTYCNFSDCCIGPVIIRFTITLHSKGKPGAPEKIAVTDAHIDSSGQQTEEPASPEISISGSSAVVQFMADSADARTSVLTRMKVCVSNCRNGDVLTVQMEVFVPTPTPTPPATSCNLPNGPDPTDPELRAVLSKSVPLTSPDSTLPGCATGSC